MCGLNGKTFKKEGYCGADEFCTGAIESDDPSTYITFDKKSTLCSRGIVIFIIVFLMKF